MQYCFVQNVLGLVEKKENLEINLKLHPSPLSENASILYYWVSYFF